MIHHLTFRRLARILAAALVCASALACSQPNADFPGAAFPSSQNQSGSGDSYVFTRMNDG